MSTNRELSLSLPLRTTPVALAKVRALALAGLRALAAWQRRHMQRRRLAELSPEALKDMGISEAEVWLETRRPFWQASHLQGRDD